MKKFPYLLLSCIIISAVSCRKPKPVPFEEHNDKIIYHDTELRKTEPVKYDSNGDGVIDDSDNSIEILGTNLNISLNPDGTPLYSPSNNNSGNEEGNQGNEGGNQGGDGGNQSSDGGNQGGDDGSQGGETPTTKPSVPIGRKLCYHNLEKYCQKTGGLYAFETSANSSMKGVQTSLVENDANQNGIADYIENLRSTTQIANTAQTSAAKFATTTEKAIEVAAGEQISGDFIKECIAEAIVYALNEALFDSNESIDVSNVEAIVEMQVTVAVIKAIEESNLISLIENKKIAEIAQSTAKNVAQDVATTVAETITKEILAQYNNQIASGSIQRIQGICPQGHHIPSDFEWMIFEQALGMSAADLTKSGETEITRGANANVVGKMVKDFGFDYGGYASINGTFAQLGEVGVYWSSTTGTDEKGDYVWVRQIDTAYSGVVRMKMYEKSGLSIRCFKD